MKVQIVDTCIVVFVKTAQYASMKEYTARLKNILNRSTKQTCIKVEGRCLFIAVVCACMKYVVIII